MDISLKNFAFVVIASILVRYIVSPYLKEDHVKNMHNEYGVKNGWLNRKGRLMHQIVMRPSGRAKTVVLFAHGAAEHCEREGYKHMFQLLVDAGMQVNCLTHQGHGRSYGDKGYVRQWSDFVDDFKEWADWHIKHRHDPTSPVFIVGHSMGALIASSLMIKEPTWFDGIMLIGIPLVIKEEMTEFMSDAMGFLSEYAPKFPLFPIEGPFSRNETSVEIFNKDPLKVSHWTARWLSEVLVGKDYVLDNMEKIEKPFAIFHGEADAGCLVEGSRVMYDGVSSTRRKRYTYPGMHHEPFEDPDFDKFFSEFKDWLLDAAS